MKGIASSVAQVRGWRRVLLLAGSGAAGALAMPPFGFLPALFLSLTVPVWVLDGIDHEGDPRRTLRDAVLAGWWWGFGYFVAGLWWLGAAFLVEADQFAWALPFGVLGLPAILAFYPAAGFAAARAIWSPGPLRILAFAAALAASEWLRGHLFTGFPWNTLGMALGQQLWLMQSASLIGLYGLTVLAIMIGAAPAALGTNAARNARFALPAASALVLLAMTGFGALHVPREPAPLVDGVRLRIMQPNLPQDAKFSAANGPAIMRHYLGVSDRPGPDGRGVAGATHLIWPESAFPFLLHREPVALAQIAGLLPAGTTLVTGAARMSAPIPGEVVGRFYNSVQVVAPDGTITASYDKTHLVPFGEYVPGFLDSTLRSLGLRQFVHIPGGFTPAEIRRPLEVPGLPPLAATICYEAIFPGAVLPDGPRPELILNVTNDAWFGNTPGPYQHFAQARLRAVEEGLSLVRAANTGISAVVDGHGRILGALPLGTEGVLDAALPQALPPTLFRKTGALGFLLLLGLCAGLGLFGRIREGRWARHKTFVKKNGFAVKA
ncbi:apolipoprotein N-acyltransferase [Microvirga massiliensis]|uniref:apolipoprotein N-acyltransferase n=1 Tax=Microvirga massiliensis TaxID=1033741 RepID=UPI0007C7E506|nr:apolipoprotein N-acyltransferase [Microvirga massiliensis]